MTAELLASVAGIILSLGFSYIPGLNTRFARLEGTYKRLIMTSMLVIVGGAIYALSCTGWWPAVSLRLPNPRQ